MFDYETLRLIWWLLLGALLVGFAITDGFDFGVGMLLHRVAKTNDERRVVINTVGPIWEGNQIWFILGGGAIFAAWPSLYAVSFSGFYYAMLLVLMGLILRPVGFKYRGKIENTRWRALWDFALFFGAFVPSLVFGVAVGNVLQGVPFYFDNTLQDFYTGSFFALLNPFGLLCGVISVVMFMMHGATYLCAKTEGDIQRRAGHYVRWCALILIILFAVAGYWITHLNGYVLTSVMPHDGPSNPLYKQVSIQVGAWLTNYSICPWLILVPMLPFVGAIFTMALVSVQFHKLAWVTSALSIAGVIATVGVSMFPFILPSSSNPSMSLMVWDASSSQLTLSIMLVCTMIFLPIILIYTSWVYHVMRGKVTSDHIEKNSKSLY